MTGALIAVGCGVISAVLLLLAGYVVRKMLDDRAETIASAAASAILAAQEHSKAVEAMAIDTRVIRDQVTPNGGDTNKLGDTIQRLEGAMAQLDSKVEHHTAKDDRQFSSLRRAFRSLRAEVRDR